MTHVMNVVMPTKNDEPKSLKEMATNYQGPILYQSMDGRVYRSIEDLPLSVVESVDKVCRTASAMITGTMQSLSQFIKDVFAKAPSIPGYKRLCKKKKLEYYQSISGDKSNNWRKYHGLPTRRR